MGQVAGTLSSAPKAVHPEPSLVASSLLQSAATPTWLYDPLACKNRWGNRAALELWQVDQAGFCAPQAASHHSSPQQGAPAPAASADASWQATNAQLKCVAEGTAGRLQLTLQQGQTHAGFLSPLQPLHAPISAACRGVTVTVKGRTKQLVLIQAVAADAQMEPSSTHDHHDCLVSLSGLGPGGPAREPSASARACGEPRVLTTSHAQHPVPAAHASGTTTTTTSSSSSSSSSSVNASASAPALQRSQQQRQQRLTAMCDNHAMFQFLFDKEGRLLAANQRAMQNMREHLGEQETYTLPMYLHIGTCDKGLTADQHFQQAVQAIFQDKEQCYRLPQLRWSKRHPGKSRWVLYEMWPLTDPITGDLALLVTEQNITQVKDMEEKFCKRMGHLEEQLQDALMAAAAGHVAVDDEADAPKSPTIDLDSAAEKTLQLLDRLLQGMPVTAQDAEELRNAIIGADTDLREPLFLNEQLIVTTRANNLEPEVGASLLQMLSSRPYTQAEPAAEAAREAGSVAAEAEAEVCEAPGTGSSPDSAGSRVLCLVTNQSSASLHAQTRSAADVVMSICASPSLEVDRLLQKATEDWRFDSFKLSDLVNGHPLSVLGFFLMKRNDLVRRLHLCEVRLARWLVQLEAGYHDNPYHNCIHAADVLRSAHMLCTRGQVLPRDSHDDLSLLAVYLSAAVHDFEHRGVNNDFLVRTADPLAIRYNDRSPQENHHAAASFTLLMADEFNFIKGLTQKQREQLRKLIIDMVLATDMKQHFAIHGMFQSKVNHYTSSRGSYGNSSNVNSNSGVLRLGSGEQQMSAAAAAAAAAGQHAGAPHSHQGGHQGPQSHAPDGLHPAYAPGSGPHPQQALQGTAGRQHRTTSNGGLNTSATPDSSSSSSRELPPSGPGSAGSQLARLSSKDASCLSSNSFVSRSIRPGQTAARVSQDDDELRSLNLQMALKCADLGHLACAKPVHRRWVKCLEEELFRQGDAERSSGLAISPLMDRTKTGITKSQTGFFDIVALPMYQIFVQRFPAAEPMLDTVKENYQMWKAEAALEMHGGSKGNM